MLECGGGGDPAERPFFCSKNLWSAISVYFSIETKTTLHAAKAYELNRKNFCNPKDCPL
jgi:hypothetical protein